MQHQALLFLKLCCATVIPVFAIFPDVWIETLQFYPGIICMELPVYRGWVFVIFIVPGLKFLF